MLGASHTLCDWQSNVGKMNSGEAIIERPSLLHNLGKMLSCPICLQLFKTAANLPCGHTFCAGCLGESLMLSAICPVCEVHATPEDTRLAPRVDIMVRTYAHIEDTTAMSLHMQSHRFLEAPKGPEGQNGNRREEADPQRCPLVRASCMQKMSRTLGGAISPRKLRLQKAVDDDGNVESGAQLLTSPSKRDRWPANLGVKRVDNVAVEGMQSDSGGEEVVPGEMGSPGHAGRQCTGTLCMSPPPNRTPGSAKEDRMVWTESTGVLPFDGNDGGKFKAPGVGTLGVFECSASPAMSTAEGISASGISGGHCRSSQGNTVGSMGERGRLAGTKNNVRVSPPCRDGSFKPFFWACDDTNASEDGGAQPAQSQGLTAGKPITFSDLLAPDGSEEVGDFATTAGARAGYSSPGPHQMARPASEPKVRMSTSPGAMMEEMAVDATGQTGPQAEETGSVKVYLKRKARDLEATMTTNEPPAKKKFDRLLEDSIEDRHLRKDDDQRSRELMNHRCSTGSASGSGGSGGEDDPGKCRSGEDGGSGHNHGEVGTTAGMSGRWIEEVAGGGGDSVKYTIQGQVSGQLMEGIDGAVVLSDRGRSAGLQCATAGVSAGLCQDSGQLGANCSAEAVNQSGFKGVNIISEHVALVQKLIGCAAPIVGDRQQGSDTLRKTLEVPAQANCCDKGTGEAKAKSTAVLSKDDKKGDRNDESDEDTSEDDEEDSESSEDDEPAAADGTHGCAFCGQIGRSAVAGRLVFCNTSDNCWNAAAQNHKPVESQNQIGVYVHKACATWSPNVYYAKGKLCNVEAELNRGRRVKCSSCSKTGAVLGCYRPRCARSYHYECAKHLDGTRFDDDNYVMLCPEHRRLNFPWESKNKKKEAWSLKGKGSSGNLDNQRPKKLHSFGKNEDSTERLNKSGTAVRMTGENSMHASVGPSMVAAPPLMNTVFSTLHGSIEEEGKRSKDDNARKPLRTDEKSMDIHVPETLRNTPAAIKPLDMQSHLTSFDKAYVDKMQKEKNKLMPHLLGVTTEAPAHIGSVLAATGDGSKGKMQPPGARDLTEGGEERANLMMTDMPLKLSHQQPQDRQPDAGKEPVPDRADEEHTGSVSLNMSGITGMTAVTTTRNDSVAAQVIGYGANTCSEGSQSVGRAQCQEESDKRVCPIIATIHGMDGGEMNERGSGPQQEKEPLTKAAKLDKHGTSKKKAGRRKKKAQSDDTEDDGISSSEEEQEGEVGEDEDYQSCSNGVDGEELGENEERNYACAFCRQKGRSSVAGALIFCSTSGQRQSSSLLTPNVQTGGGVYVHRECATWAPNVFYKQDKLCNVDAEVNRGRKIRCAVCLKPGAVLGCFRKKCPRSYHYTCAVKCQGARFDEDRYVMLCPEHSQSNFPWEPKNRKKVGLNKGPQRDMSDAMLEESGNKKRGGAQKGTPQKADRADLLSPRRDVCGGVLFPALTKASRLVICGSGLSSSEKELLDAVSSMNGFSQEKQWSQSVTHVIASVNGNRCGRRTLKFLFSVLHGQWVVTPEWLTACRKAGKPVAEEPFEVIGDIHCAFNGPSQGRIRLLAKAPPLLKGLYFYLSGEFALPSKLDISRIITAGGGTVLSQLPEDNVKSISDGGDSAVSSQRTLIVLYNGNTPPMPQASTPRDVSPPEFSDEQLQACPTLRRWKDAQAVACAAGSDAVAVSHMWLLDTVAVCELRDTALYSASPSLT